MFAQNVLANYGAGKCDANSVKDKAKLVTYLRKAVDSVTLLSATRRAHELSANERDEAIAGLDSLENFTRFPQQKAR